MFPIAKRGYGAGQTARFFRRYGGCRHTPLPDLLSVHGKNKLQHIAVRICKETLVLDLHTIPRRAQREILIVELHILQFCRRTTIGKENTVAAEVVVRRTVAEVPAIEKYILTVPPAPTNCLIAKIPDKAALIERLALRQLRVLVHTAAAVAHCVRILTADKGLVPVLLEERLDVRRLRIHLAFHIARCGIAAIPENSLVVNEARRIDAAEVFAHLVDVTLAAGLVAARPDENARMVLVALVHRLCAVKHGGQPSLVSAGHGMLVFCTCAVLHPRTVRLEIRLVDHIESVNIAQLIETAAVRVM